MTVLPLSEVFGPTWQGEGPACGRRTAFVRLGLCNLTCEWCDTPYTWDTSRFDVAAECPDTDVAVIHDRLRAIDARMVTLSGGEPLLHHQRLRDLLDPTWEWHVETNGTIAPPDWWEDYVEHTTVSPKVITADPEKRRIKPRALAAWNEYALAGRACFKFVAATPDDLPAITAVVQTVGIRAEDVWIMPEGITPSAVLDHHRALADAILAAGYNTTTRLHTLLWGDERGR